MVKEMKVNQTNQTNPQKVNSPSMEVFLTPETKPVPQSKPKEEQPKPKVPDKQPKIEEPAKAKDTIEKIEGEIANIEKLLGKVRTIEFSRFSQLAYEKKLKFKLLMITSRIYVEVTDGNREAIIALSIPRWGGSGLRYLVSACSTQYCQAVEKQTSKGKVIAYAPLGSVDGDDEEPDDDIFD